MVKKQGRSVVLRSLRLHDVRTGWHEDNRSIASIVVYNAGILIGLRLQRWLNAKPSFTGASQLNHHLTSTYA